VGLLLGQMGFWPGRNQPPTVREKRRIEMRRVGVRMDEDDVWVGAGLIVL